MKKLNFKRVVKDNLKNIKYWKKMDDKDFINKEYVCLKNGILDLELEFIISKTFISYSSRSSIYDLDEESLLKISKENGFRIIYPPKNFDFIDDYIFIANKLIDKGYKIIPLDDKILVDSNEDINIEYNDMNLLVEEIKE